MRNHLAVVFLAGAGLVLSSGLSARAGQVPAAEKEIAAAGQDLQGVWNLHATMAQFLHYLASTYTAQEPDMTPWAKKKFEEAKPSFGRDITVPSPRVHSLKETDDPVLKYCYPPGTPRIYLQPFPMQIVQTPKEVIILYEYDHTVRHIYTDGRPHPPDLTPTYMGDSIGHWDGDTLVVDTIGFNDKTWLDRDGTPHSDQLHVIERFTRTSPAGLQIAITMEDPKALVKPWQATLDYQLKPDWNIMEQVCTDNIDFLNFEH